MISNNSATLAQRKKDPHPSKMMLIKATLTLCTYLTLSSLAGQSVQQSTYSCFCTILTIKHQQTNKKEGWLQKPKHLFRFTFIIIHFIFLCIFFSLFHLKTRTINPKYNQWKCTKQSTVTRSFLLSFFYYYRCFY